MDLDDSCLFTNKSNGLTETRLPCLGVCLGVILGTEEEVYIRRRIFALLNRISKHLYEFRGIVSGRREEGLFLPDSDVDRMEVNGNISVSENPNDLDIDIVMITKDIKPGFAKLRCSNIQKNKLYFGDGLIQTHEGLFLSRFLQEMFNQFLCAVAHGPCLSIQVPLRLDLDLVRCLRRHNWWPSSDLIQDIVQDGCLLVPFGNPYSQESHLQWRISFSLAETKLVHSFNHNQYLCYGLLKLFLKHAINSNTQVKDLLCSLWSSITVYVLFH
ncbi:hypothetical protein KUTeg_010787 [Tegillarca granosa]|uniref:Mab-21-like HhH/H2TH-like domain-containing protein n=1 Tax=Tegillarca granosa TaxID=220873 RepID=A0ABQ9F565_TEGGR|nr:hypothetical protein KUTeg_010787 [Tegillarca granosa]